MGRVFDLTKSTRSITAQVRTKYGVNALIAAKRMAGIATSAGRSKDAKVWAAVVKTLERGSKK